MPERVVYGSRATTVLEGAAADDELVELNAGQSAALDPGRGR